MTQMTVMKVDITCKRCKKKLLKAVSRLKGIDKIEADVEKGTLIVTGNADPCEVVTRVRKAAGRCVEVLSIGPPPKPKPDDKPKPDGGDDKPKPDDKPKDCIPSRSCHSCEHVYIIWDYPDVSCSIL